MKQITIFGASSDSIPDLYKKESYLLGKLIAEKNWKQYNGGGKHGVMGAATQGGLEAGGEVHGIIIEVYRQFQADGLTSCISVEYFHDRKQGLIDAGDAIVVMPGGIGTLNESFHVIDDLIADIHRGFDSFIPLIFVNINQFFDPLMSWIEGRMIEENFLNKQIWEKVVHLVNGSREAVNFIEKNIKGRNEGIK